MIKRQSWRTFLFFLRAYPSRSALMIAALTLAGFLEGVGMMALLPLISILSSQEISGGHVSMLVTGMFNTLGITPAIPNLLLFIVSVIVLKAIINVLAIAQVAYASSHVTARLRMDFMQKLMSARWLHLVGIRSGTIANAMGIEAMRSALSFKQGCQALAYIIQIFVYSIVVMLVSWQLTLAAIGAGSVLVLALSTLTRVTRKAGLAMTVTSDRVLSLITDSLYGAKPLKAMSKGGNLLRMVDADVKTLQIAQRRLDMADQSIPVLSEPLMIIFVALGLYFALSYSGLPLAELLFMAAVFLRMTMRISSAQRSYQGMVSNESALFSLQKKMDEAENAREDFSGNKPPLLNRSIDLENVTFTYGGRNIIEELNLHIPVNSITAIIGPSGTGKTTIIDLITSLLEPAGGVIKIDSVPLAEIDKKAWKSQIGYVPQDVLLFHDTLLNNITLGDSTLSRQDVEDSLEAAGASEFVTAMEQGLDTVVGERGAKLSGGQRQRIAIARALVHKPQLLILDEATSALDPITEKEILGIITEVSKTVTVLAISHNAALLEVADQVFHLSDGKAVKGRQQPKNLVAL
jgi:ATP-binding cassette subfamily C protein